MPSATTSGHSDNLWKIEQTSMAIANGYFVGTNNRVGREAPWNFGEFYGSSYFCNPYGEILAIGSRDKDELVVADLDHSFLLSGTGELIEPDDGIVAIGSGGNFALAAARALLPEPDWSARKITQRSLEIAADICVFTNRNITILELPGETGKK